VDDPEKGLDDDNIIMHDGNGPCKHLSGDKPGEYSCNIHKKSWYKETPCFKHTQVENDPTEECRLGRYILDNDITNF
jgi:hypothetical protein